MASKFNRKNFLTKEKIDGKYEYDLLNNYFYLFDIKRPYDVVKISRTTIGRPDLLSIQQYGDKQYWWVISKVNAIDDWWNDVEIGQDIIVPNLADIKDFYTSVKKERK